MLLETFVDQNAAFQVFDSEGNLLADADEQGRAQQERASISVNAGESYFVFTTENVGTPNIEGQSLDAIEAVALDASNSGATQIVLSAGVADAVKITANRAGNYRVSIDSGFVGRFRVFDDTGFESERLVLKDPNVGPATIDLILIEGQTVVIGFDANLGDGTPGTATLSVAGPAESIEGLDVDDARVLTAGSTFNGTVQQIGQKFLFEFTVTSANIVQLFAQGSGGLDVRMKIYDEQGGLLSTEDDSGTNILEFFQLNPGDVPVGSKIFVVLDSAFTIGDFAMTAFI